MTALLFDIPAYRPNELETARQRLAAAQEAFETAGLAVDYYGLFKAGIELNNARHCAALLESLEIGGMR